MSAIFFSTESPCDEASYMMSTSMSSSKFITGVWLRESAINFILFYFI
jgi:hypothetical protein